MEVRPFLDTRTHSPQDPLRRPTARLKVNSVASAQHTEARTPSQQALGRAPSWPRCARSGGRRSAQSSVSPAPTRTTSTPRSIGWQSASSGSRSGSRAATSRTVSLCSTTSRRAISRGAAARWPSSATRATNGAARCRSSTAYSATGRGGRSRSRCSAASCTTTRRCRPRSTSSNGASAWRR
jgi:hypothetical protein